MKAGPVAVDIEGAITERFSNERNAGNAESDGPRVFEATLGALAGASLRAGCVQGTSSKMGSTEASGRQSRSIG